MTWIYRLLPVLLLLFLSACALGEGAETTPAPPLTLPPPPPLRIEGDCVRTEALDTWLQSTELFVSEFLSAVNTAANQQRGELHGTVVRMARVRDAANITAAPDCVVNIHLLFVETMNTAIDSLQAYANGDRDNLGNLVPETISQLDRVTAGHNELKARLEAQYQSQRTS